MLPEAPLPGASRCLRRRAASLPPSRPRRDGRQRRGWHNPLLDHSSSQRSGCHETQRSGTSFWLACVLAAAGCATKKGFEKPGFAFGCPIGDAKVSSMEDLVKVKTVDARASAPPSAAPRCAARRPAICSRSTPTSNNDSSKVKRIAYKFRWIDREGMRACGRGDLEAAADVRELQPARHHRGADQQGGRFPPDPAEPGMTARTSRRMTMLDVVRKPPRRGRDPDRRCRWSLGRLRQGRQTRYGDARGVETVTNQFGSTDLQMIAESMTRSMLQAPVDRQRQPADRHRAGSEEQDQRVHRHARHHRQHPRRAAEERQGALRGRCRRHAAAGRGAGAPAERALRQGAGRRDGPHGRRASTAWRATSSRSSSRSRT